MTGPIILITIGVMFLLNNIDPERFQIGRMWPVILIVIGLVKIVEYFGPQGRRAPSVTTERPGTGRYRESAPGEPVSRDAGASHSADAVEAVEKEEQ